MAVRVIKFKTLEKNLSGRAGWKELLCPSAGSVLALLIGRDGCPGCVKFKPAFEKLARAFAGRRGRPAKFARIHISCPGGSMTESIRAKKLLGHYFYPTAVVLARSKDLGVFEYHRAISPSIPELQRAVTAALRAAKILAGK